jgi:RecB family exonuclease
VPRKPTLSPTKFATFLACPVKYRWTYVDPRGKPFLRAKSYFSFGASLHRVLQRFHDAGDVGVATAEDAVRVVESEWIGAGYESPEASRDAMAQGKEIVARYTAGALAVPAVAKTLFVERQLRADMGEFDLIGRIDRLDEHDDGTLEIVDYKSGRESVDEADVASDLALGCYQLLVKRKYPDHPVRATIVALRTGDSASWSMPTEEVAQFEADIVALGKQILETEFPEIVPVWKPLCATCDFLPLCVKHPDFELPGSTG